MDTGRHFEIYKNWKYFLNRLSDWGQFFLILAESNMTCSEIIIMLEVQQCAQVILLLQSVIFDAARDRGA